MPSIYTQPHTPANPHPTRHRFILITVFSYRGARAHNESTFQMPDRHTTSRRGNNSVIRHFAHPQNTLSAHHVSQPEITSASRLFRFLSVVNHTQASPPPSPAPPPPPPPPPPSSPPPPRSEYIRLRHKVH